LAATVAAQLNAVTVPGDDFFAATLTDHDWEKRTPAERARDAIDWRRLRAEALEPLLAGKRAAWYPFDFVSGVRPDGTYRMNERAEIREPSPVIVLDGMYSTRPELADLIDLSVLVEVPAGRRHQRLSERENADFLDDWHARWDEVETWYFSRVRPRSAFDIVVPNE
jgi:uridine kinase